MESLVTGLRQDIVRLGLHEVVGAGEAWQPGETGRVEVVGT